MLTNRSLAGLQGNIAMVLVLEELTVAPAAGGRRPRKVHASSNCRVRAHARVMNKTAQAVRGELAHFLGSRVPRREAVADLGAVPGAPIGKAMGAATER